MKKELINETVSVIVTTYNRSVYLRECLQSIQNQIFENIEILVVDDGSNTINAKANKLICSHFSKSKYYYKKNTGQPDSRNYGIKRSRGNYIAFCDDDDIWVKDKLKEQIELMSTNQNCFVITADIGFIDEYGKELSNIKSHKGFNSGFIFKNLLEKNRTSSVVPLLRKEVFDRVGLFNPSYTIAEDWEFWRRVSYYFEFFYIEKVHAYVRLHASNMTNESIQNTQFGSYILYRKLTKDLLKWGVGRFSKEEYILIEDCEWTYVKRILKNQKGIKGKIIFFAKLFKNNIIDGLYLTLLIIKNLKKYK